jgi:hypothetical protein
MENVKMFVSGVAVAYLNVLQFTFAFEFEIYCDLVSKIRSYIVY